MRTHISLTKSLGTSMPRQYHQQRIITFLPQQWILNMALSYSTNNLGTILISAHISQKLFYHDLPSTNTYVIFSDLFYQKGWLWVDAYDPEGNGIYTNSRSGSRLAYHNWRTGEPNALATDKCGYMHTRSTGWNNIPCNTNAPIICEYDLI